MLTVSIENGRYEPAMPALDAELVDHVQSEKIDESISEVTRHRAEDGTSILIDWDLAHIHELLREPERDFLVPCVLDTGSKTVLIANRKTDRPHRGADGGIVEGEPARQHPLRRKLILRTGGDVKRMLEMQILAQTYRVLGIDADIHQAELAPVLPADAAE